MSPLGLFGLTDPARRLGSAFVLTVAVIMTAAVVSGQIGGDEPAAAVPASNNNAPIVVQVGPTATVAPRPATELPNRTSCASIEGTSYRSEAERVWYQQNCQIVVTPGPTATAGPVRAVATTLPAQAVTQAAPPAPAGGIQISTVQTPMGDRLVIPSAGVDAEVYRAQVPYEAAMPDPQGYFNAVYYDFAALADWGIGGYVDSGNVVLSGHVDCGRCYNGGAGIAVFWHVRNLQPGDTAQYITSDGRVTNYVVVGSTSQLPSIDMTPYIANGAADMTLITCTGSFSGGDYNLRHIVSLRKTG
jgi:hypothetical protein